jgi:peptidyl-prolyl cis-trans isomerase A (cyclophilin A)
MNRFFASTGLLLAAALTSTGIEAASWKETPGMYAVIETTHGTIVAELFADKTPKTVENFAGLAMATKEYTDTKVGGKAKRNFYDGLTFHRIIPNFMMQGGDPDGTGRGGPGYRFEDEIVPDLKFDKGGRLAMANSGPNSNGSQFFITQVPTEWLNGRHTIFGQVVEGMDKVDTICATLGSGSGAPKEPVIMKKVRIETVGAKATETK